MFKSTQVCGNPSKNCLPQLQFKEFHIFFRNLRHIFRELCSRAHEVFRVWAVTVALNGILGILKIYKVFLFYIEENMKVVRCHLQIQLRSVVTKDCEKEPLTESSSSLEMSGARCLVATTQPTT